MINIKDKLIEEVLDEFEGLFDDIKNKKLWHGLYLSYATALIYELILYCGIKDDYLNDNQVDVIGQEIYCPTDKPLKEVLEIIQIRIDKLD